jgi:2-deoxy-D-gluconate 3-dehydrogenase
VFDLTGKVAVVTGGNGGIGLGMAGGLARAGATVVIAGRNAEKSSQAVADLKMQGFTADAIQADVTDEHQVARLFQDVMVRHGRLDILVNNAGSTIRKAPEALTLQEFQQVMDVNLTSTFLCCRAAHALMKVGGGGKIVNIGSML